MVLPPQLPVSERLLNCDTSGLLHQELSPCLVASEGCCNSCGCCVASSCSPDSKGLLDSNSTLLHSKEVLSAFSHHTVGTPCFLDAMHSSPYQCVPSQGQVTSHMSLWKQPIRYELIISVVRWSHSQSIRNGLGMGCTTTTCLELLQ